MSYHYLQNQQLEMDVKQEKLTVSDQYRAKVVPLLVDHCTTWQLYIAYGLKICF